MDAAGKIATKAERLVGFCECILEVIAKLMH